MEQIAASWKPPSKKPKCDVCGKECANATGLAMHKLRSHTPGKNWGRIKPQTTLTLTHVPANPEPAAKKQKRRANKKKREPKWLNMPGAADKLAQSIRVVEEGQPLPPGAPVAAPTPERPTSLDKALVGHAREVEARMMIKHCPCCGTNIEVLAKALAASMK